MKSSSREPRDTLKRWQFLLMAVIFFAICVTVAVFFHAPMVAVPVFQLLMFALCWERLKDAGQSRLLTTLLFLPIVGLIVIGMCAVLPTASPKISNTSKS